MKFKLRTWPKYTPHVNILIKVSETFYLGEYNWLRLLWGVDIKIKVHMCIQLCECARGGNGTFVCRPALLTALWFIPSVSAVAVWGPVCVMPMHRGLYVIEVGPWKPPAIWTSAAQSVCLSIRQFPLIAIVGTVCCGHLTPGSSIGQAH